MGIAVACLAPAAVSTAISLWGDAQQQATYLPAFVGDDVPAAALGADGAPAAVQPVPPAATARAAGGGYVLDGVKSLVPRASDAELFVIAAALDNAGPALFIVESRTAGISVEPEPAHGRARRGHRAPHPRGRRAARRLRCWAATSIDVYKECVALGRLAWCALAVGTGQAVLDYVTTYVKDRKAFGEPIANRQAVAFAVANIAIELEGMRLVTYRAAARVDQGLPFAREVALARRLLRRQGDGRSAPTACSCSAATASSRSTRSSGGTATSAPPA